MNTTSDLYTTFGTLLTSSKTLVTALEKSDWLDRLLILSSLAFFLLVVAYILKKRIIDKGVWLAFWWVKYLPIGKGSTASTSTAAKHVAASVSSIVMSSVAAVIPSAASSLRSSVAQEVYSSAFEAATTISAEASQVTSLASSIMDEVISQRHDSTTTIKGEEKTLELHAEDGASLISILPESGEIRHEEL